MSYYEWVSTIKTLKESPIDDDIIKKLDNSKIEQYNYVITRLIFHLYDTIDERLNRAGYLCIKGIVDSKGDVNAIELDFINLKKEKKYALKLVSLKIFDEELKEKMKRRINIKFEDISSFIKNTIKNIDSNGLYINTFEKIMSSSMEG